MTFGCAENERGVDTIPAAAYDIHPMTRSMALSLALVPPLVLVYSLRDQIFEGHERWRNRPPCQRVLDESEIRAATGGRVRGPDVTTKAGRCVADWGAAVVTLGAYTKYTAGFEDVLDLVRARPGFVKAAPAGGSLPATIAELDTHIADRRRKTKVILFDRGAGGWAEIALHFDEAAIAGPGSAPLDSLVTRIGLRLANPETAVQ